MTTLENRFPLLAVEHGCIISKDADITVAFEVELPELYTVTGAEYEAIHSCWCKAIKVLPDYSVVHKQDWFIKERYKPELQKDDMSFLSRSFERHFNERPYLKHTCYLYLTKTTKERKPDAEQFQHAVPGTYHPKELDRETTTKFLEACEQFERIMNDSGLSGCAASPPMRLWVLRERRDLLNATSRSCRKVTPPCRTSSFRQGRCASATTACVCTPSPTRKTCRARWLPTPVTRSSPPTGVTADCHSPPRWGFCSPATISTTSMC